MNQPSRPFAPASALLLLLVYYGASAVVLLIGDSLSDDQVGIIFFAAAAVVAPLAATYVGLIRHAPEQATAAALRVERPRGRTWIHIGLAVVCGLALAPLASEVMARLLELMPKDPAADDQLAEWLASAQQPPTQILIVLTAAAREMLFRGLMLPRLVRPVGIFRAVVFVAMFDVATQPFGPAPVAAIPFCLLALASGTTWAPILGTLALYFAPDNLFAGRSVAVLVGSTAVALATIAVAWRLRVAAPEAPTSSSSPG